MSDIPEWAKERACELGNAEPGKCDSFHWAPDQIGPGGLAAAFARYIAEHEEPPADPLAQPMLAALCEAFRQVGGSMIHSDFSPNAASPNGEKIVNILIPELRRLGIELSLQETQP